MTVEDILNLRKDYEAGVSFSILSEKYHLQKGSILYYARNLDIEKFKQKEEERKTYEKKVCELATQCTNANQIAKILGKGTSRQSLEAIDNILKKYNQSYSNECLHHSLITKQRMETKSLEEILVNGSVYNSTKLRNRLIQEGLKEHRCESCNKTHWVCKITNWEKVPIPLQLHHLNGDHNDNRLENLQLICPTCHALTDNYAGKNITKEKETHICEVCHKEFEHKRHSTNRFCSKECYYQYHKLNGQKEYRTYKADGKENASTISINKNDFEKLFIKTGGYKGIERELNMRQSSACKLAVSLGLPKSGKEMRKYIIEKYGPQPQWTNYLNKTSIGQTSAVEMCGLNGKIIESFNSIKEIEEKYPDFKAHGISRAISKYNGKYKDKIFRKINIGT